MESATTTVPQRRQITGCLKGKGHPLDCPLTHIKKISHDTYIYTYQLPDPELPLGIDVGGHVFIEAKVPTKEFPEGTIVKRKYTPVSPILQKGSFDMLIKIYRANCHPEFPEGGALTPYLENIKLGESIRISGPVCKLTYHGHGSLTFSRDDPAIDLTIKHFGLIAGGTGIAPMYQIIKAILDDPTDQTKVTLLFANKTEEDIIMRAELEEAAKDPRITVYYTVDHGSEGWTGFTGYVNKEMIEKTMPPPGPDSFLWLCGNKPMHKYVRPFFVELGYDQTTNRI